MSEFASREALAAAIEAAKPNGELTQAVLHGCDLSGMDFSGVDCSWWNLVDCILDGCSFAGGSIAHGKFERCSFKNADFSRCNMEGADLRCADLRNADIRGANLYSAWLEQAKLDGIQDDENTKYFRLRCPEKGAFIAYKKCYEDRVAMLLIPADAKRVSATNNACRCNKAKVLTITSVDFTRRYSWANSYVDENFIYREGEWAIPDRFTEDRWVESTYGIHFWMTREEAIAY